MIDDFLTSPDDLPSLRVCRSARRDAAVARDPDATPDGALAASASPPASGGTGLAASVVLVVAMIALPAFAPATLSSKTPDVSYRTL